MIQTDETELPDLFLRRIRGQLGEETPEFLSAMKLPSVRGIRFHPDRRVEDLQKNDLEEQIPWSPMSFFLRTDSERGRTVAHEAGAFYLQEPSAMIAAQAMDAQPGERILDLCAAPGGKSTQLGIAMRGKGLLVSNEPVAKRAQVLSRNIERMGIPNAVVTCAWPEQLASRWPDGFDGVLADVPCSGEGMFRRDPETRKEWTEEKSKGCAVRQAEILESAARLVRPGGRLIYATCTWNPEENERQMERFLYEHPMFEPEGFQLPGVRAPLGSFTCWIHRFRGEGQFIMKLRRKGTGQTQLPIMSGKKVLTGDAARNWQRDFSFLPEPNGIRGTLAYHLPAAPDLEGLRVFRTGLHLAELRDKTILPDHAAALNMEFNNGPVTDISGESALRFLAGQEIEGSVSGWTAIRWNGLVLGWGKGSSGKIKNHYPKGLRNTRLIL